MMLLVLLVLLRGRPPAVALLPRAPLRLKIRQRRAPRVLGRAAQRPVGAQLGLRRERRSGAAATATAIAAAIATAIAAAAAKQALPQRRLRAGAEAVRLPV